MEEFTSEIHGDRLNRLTFAVSANGTKSSPSGRTASTGSDEQNGSGHYREMALIRSKKKLFS
jgi:hypothetical protein